MEVWVTQDILEEYKQLPYWLDVKDYPDFAKPMEKEVGSIVKKRRVVKRVFR